MLNGDMTRSVFVRDIETPWSSSPASQVSRKRFHLVGEPESGQVTSRVRYAPGASFPRHEHPEGEEILVLTGVFSDEAGDWPSGSYLLNPEGFAHAPFSKPGCELFVKLRQYSGHEHLALNISEVTPVTHDGFSIRTLFQNESEQVTINHVTSYYQDENTTGMEGFLLNGTLTVNNESLTQHDWFRIPGGEPVEITGSGTLYLKSGALDRLRSDP